MRFGRWNPTSNPVQSPCLPLWSKAPVSRTSRVLTTILGLGAGAIAGSLLSRRAMLAINPGYFSGKVVMIIGASRGIGRELALDFAGAGANLVLAARSEDQLSVAAAECAIIQPGIHILIAPIDITDEGHLKHLTNSAMDSFGHIDILVNNAGIMQGGALYEIGGVSLRKHFEVNVLGPMRLTQMILPYMLARRQGHIVIMASAAGRHSMPFFAAYSATKHALIGFADGLRRELAGTGIKVTTVNPGFTDTEMVSDAQRAWHRMGFSMIPPELVAKRALEAIQLGLVEVNIGWLETFGGWANGIVPGAADLYWRIFAPSDLPQIAATQNTK